MPKPKKIRKRKSFMFTTRHYSLMATVAFIMGVCSIVGMIMSIMVAFTERGKPPVHLGGVGFFGAIGDIVGLISAFFSLSERDIFRWVSYGAIIINGLALLLWVALIILGI